MEDALSSISPHTDDIIKSQAAFSQYDTDLGWMGSLNWMEPGKGYMLQLAGADTLVYPGAGYDGAKGDINCKILAKSSVKNDTLAKSPWDLNISKYRNNMNIIADIEKDTSGAYDPADVIVALCGKEVRGIARPIYFEKLGTYRVFMNIYGITNDDIDLKIWDASTDITYRANEHLTFTENEILGKISKPIKLTKAELRSGDKGYVPDKFSLSNNYPNPFNPVTKMGFGLPENASTVIKIYNIRGQEIKTLIDKEMAPGYYYMFWNGTNDYGRQMSSGVYLIVMKAKGDQNFRMVKKVTLIR
ncbi:MAG: hypothetical protein KAI81_06350 [Candidatus Marinimicrobia bacterium]|nr:hypothetical protein [Candidatus Neomarinimicrobiota bacterium]